jgi:ABC-type sugar transport system substrate-binding protein
MKITFRSTIICACLLLIASCNRGGSSGGGDASKNMRLAFVTNNASDFWTIARKGTEKADAELNDATVEFRIPSDGTAAEQKRLIDDLLARGVEGIALSPVDPDNQTQLINETAKRVLVVTQDSDAPKSDRVLGGCSLRGGEGSIIGILIGAALLQVLQNLVNLLGIPSSLNFAVMGAVILLGVIADQLLQRRTARAT